jgi:hypothetical protein
VVILLEFLNVSHFQKFVYILKYDAIPAVIDRFMKIGILSIKDETTTYGQIYMYREYISIFTTEH